MARAYIKPQPPATTTRRSLGRLIVARPLAPTVGRGIVGRLGVNPATGAAARGVLTYPMQGCVDGDSGDHLLLAPPAVIAPEEIRWAVDELAAAIQEAAR